MVVSITRYTITFISLNIFFFSFNKGVEPYNPTQFNHYNINLIFFSFNKGVEPYNQTQSNHYNINLICLVIQSLIFKLVMIINYIFTCLYILYVIFYKCL